MNAHIEVKHTRHGDLVAWGWESGIGVSAPGESDAMEALTEEAEQRIGDPGDVDHNTRLADVRLVDGTVERVEWLNEAADE